MDDPSIFPQHYGEPFPPCFQEVICAIFKRLFRVYAHIYHSHFKHICALKEEAHLNTCFKHFMYFTEVGSLHPSDACGVSLMAVTALHVLPIGNIWQLMILPWVKLALCSRLPGAVSICSSHPSPDE